MDAGTYAATSALEAYAKAQEVIAHNLANINTSGFKRRLTLFEPFHARLAAELGDQAGTQVDGVVIDFSPGPLQTTGRPYDLALRGNGFFALEGPSGQLYTRKGSFSCRGDGVLVDDAGRPVLGAGGGLVTIPRDTREVTVDRGGRIYADGSEAGQVWVVDIPRPAALAPAALGAFALPAGSPAPATLAHPDVLQGMLEGSNTIAVDEMVSMISNLRSFEAAQRALLAIDESTEQLTQAASQPT